MKIGRFLASMSLLTGVLTISSASGALASHTDAGCNPALQQARVTIGGKIDAAGAPYQTRVHLTIGAVDEQGNIGDWIDLSTLDPVSLFEPFVNPDDPTNVDSAIDGLLCFNVFDELTSTVPVVDVNLDPVLDENGFPVVTENYSLEITQAAFNVLTNVYDYTDNQTLDGSFDPANFRLRVVAVADLSAWEYDPAAPIAPDWGSTRSDPIDPLCVYDEIESAYLCLAGVNPTVQVDENGDPIIFNPDTGDSLVYFAKVADVSMQEPTVWGQDATAESRVVHLWYPDIDSQVFWSTFDLVPMSTDTGLFAGSVDLGSFDGGDPVKVTGSVDFPGRATMGRVQSIVHDENSGLNTLPNVTNGNLVGEIVSPLFGALPDGVTPLVTITDVSTFEPLQDFHQTYTGSFFGNLAEGSVYRIQASGGGFSSTGGWVTLADDGAGGSILVESDADGNTDPEVDPSEFLSVNGDLVTIALAEPDFTFQVVDPSGSPVADDPDTGVPEDPTVQLAYWCQDIGDNYDLAPGCFSGNGQGFRVATGAQIMTEGGVFGLSPSVSGRFVLVISPSVFAEGSPPLATTGFIFDYDVDTRQLTPCLDWDGYAADPGPQCSGEQLTANDPADPYNLALEVPDFTVGVTDVEGDAAVAQVLIQKWNTETGSFAPNYVATGVSNVNGEIGFTFNSARGIGAYRLEASPINSELVEAPKRLIFCIAPSDPENQESPLVLDADCETEGIQESSEVSADRIDVQFVPPNVTGTVYVGDDDPASYSGIEIATWLTDCPGGEGYCASDFVGSNEDGEFAFLLDPNDSGRPYRLTFYPPFGTSEVAATTKYVFVDDLYETCFVAANFVDDAGDYCEGLEAESAFGAEIFLSEPNLSGRVLPEAAGSYTSVSVTVWNGNGFEYTGDSFIADDEGRFAFALDTGRTYKITADSRAIGYSQSSAIITVFDDGWCSTSLNQRGAPVVDDACDRSDDELEITLAGSNFGGVVTSGDGVVADAWVEVVYTNEYGWQSFVNAAPTLFNGRFELRIELPAEGAAWKEVTVRVNPPWFDSSLAREERSYWVGDVDGDGLADNICREEPMDGECDDLVEVDDLEEFELGTGNVTGQVIDSNGGGVGFVGVDVQRIVEEDWGTWYEWTDIWRSTDEDGNFTLDIPEPGSYRINARAWGYSDLGDGKVDVCILEGGVLDANCDGEGDEDGTTVDIELGSPNVTGRLENGADPVADAWVVLEQKFTYDFGDGPTDYWFYGGSWTASDDSGNFALFADPVDATYRLRIEPSWSSGIALVGFTTSEFYSADFSGDPPSIDLGSIGFPAPDLELTVVDQTGEPVPYVSVHLEYWNGSYWEWTDAYGFTRDDGTVALSSVDLEVVADNPVPGWRVVVDRPWWDSESVLAPFSKNLDDLSRNPDGDVIVDFVEFPAPNLTGTVRVSGEPMSWAWVSVFDDQGQYVDGAPSNRAGSYALNLEPGDYRLVVYPNWEIGLAPVEVVVSVDGNGVTSWSYAATPSQQECTGADGCTVDVDLAVDLPTFALEITGWEGVGTGPDLLWITLTPSNGGPSLELTSNNHGLFDVSLADFGNDYDITVVNFDIGDVAVTCRKFPATPIGQGDQINLDIAQGESCVSNQE